MKTPGRIRNEASYRAGQPDLDVYNACFEGYASPRFCGTDLDGLFTTAHATHGVWEREGYFLVHEHKASPTAWKLGQWIALNQLAELGAGAHDRALAVVERSLRLSERDRAVLVAGFRREFEHRIMVVVTYGDDPDSPTSYHRLPIPQWEKGLFAASLPSAPVHLMWLDRIETVPHRKWIKWVHRRARS